MRQDAYGLPVSTESPLALESYDRAVDGLLLWDNQALDSVWFWQGKFPQMLDLAATLTRYYPGNSFMLGLHAFALEEAGRCDEAIRMAQVALHKNPRDAWAIHAFAHALYEMAAFDTGITRLPPAIHPCRHLGWFKNHLLWHLTLMHFAGGEYERASQL